MQANAPVTQRVLKEIRMRVHRNCHKCDTPYGSEKICVKCGHKKCKACPRYPYDCPISKYISTVC